jgi:predicted flap endonuclease-1-like 5' DNA nuclease
MEWLSFFIGAFAGWVVEWFIDVLYWRRKYARSNEIEAQLRAELADAQEDINALRARLSRPDLPTTRVPGAAEIGAVPAAAMVGAGVAAAATVAEDDLTIIEGIGPKIAKLLNQHGIHTFAELADTDVESLRVILRDGGAGFQMADPTSWPRQAKLAANRDWVKLTALKQQLVGGVRRPSPVEEPADDLTIIEGIGPKIAKLLEQHGIHTFAELADTDVESLRVILRDGGAGFHMADPTSWPRQAGLAAKRDWVRLTALKQQLVGGVRKPSTEEDNLTMIEGIGPQISALLKEHGIRTFAQLARTNVERLRTILEEGGPQFRFAAPDTWPIQARLAASGSWEQLQTLQDRLTSGREQS